MGSEERALTGRDAAPAAFRFPSNGLLPRIILSVARTLLFSRWQPMCLLQFLYQISMVVLFSNFFVKTFNSKAKVDGKAL